MRFTFRHTFKIPLRIASSFKCMQTGLSRHHVVSTLSSHETKYAYRSKKREKLLKRGVRANLLYQIYNSISRSYILNRIASQRKSVTGVHRCSVHNYYKRNCALVCTVTLLIATS